MTTQASRHELISPFRILKGMVKFSSFAAVLFLFLCHHSLILFVIRDEKKRLKYFLRSIRFTSIIGLWILNVRITCVGLRGEVKERLIVANHLSYLDVLVLFSRYPSLFITSTDIRDTFLLGRICQLAGCFFVERNKRRHTPETKIAELSQMKEKLALGFNVFLFPEGTSSDGAGVLPFKSTFFQLAVDSDTPVIPLCLRYTEKTVPWYGDMTFPDHLFSLCMEDSITCTLEELPEVVSDNKTEFARQTFDLIREAYERN